ncbi:hypothetical protein Dimus_032934 [Dionaea muscipula]
MESDDILLKVDVNLLVEDDGLLELRRSMRCKHCMKSQSVIFGRLKSQMDSYVRKLCYAPAATPGSLSGAELLFENAVEFPDAEDFFFNRQLRRLLTILASREVEIFRIKLPGLTIDMNQDSYFEEALKMRKSLAGMNFKSIMAGSRQETKPTIDSRILKSPPTSSAVQCSADNPTKSAAFYAVP